MNRLILLVIALFFSMKIFSQGDDVWTLERCINHALQHNIDLKRQELQKGLAEKDYRQEMYNILLGMGAGVEHQLSTGRSLNLEKYEWEDRSKQQGSAGIRADLTLFRGLTNYNSIQRGKFRFLSSEADLEAYKNDMTLSLAAYYLDILFSEELVEVASSQYEVTRMQVERNKRLVDVGKAAKSELLEMQAQAASEKLKLTEAKNTLEMAILDLTQLLDLDSVGNFSVYRPDINIELLEVPPAVTQIYTDAVRSMPEIRSAEYMLKAQEKDLAVARGNRSPEISLSGLYYSRYLVDAVNPIDASAGYSLEEQLEDNQYKQLTINMSIPIFSRFRLQTNIGKSKILLDDYRYILEQEKQILYKKIQQYHTDVTAAWEKYLSALEAVNSNEEAFNYTRQKFEVGLVNSVDFNIAKTDLTRARANLVQAKYEYIFKIKILDFYQGKPIQL
ncbi:MAG: TolC family protein [Bacteroidota bacterium]